MLRSLAYTLVVGSLVLTGCGGGSSSSSSATDVEVERGKVYNATVTDADGNTATQKSGKNIYTFSSTPTYPISVSGGWIDVDGDGEVDSSDIELDITLQSYSNTVTTVTTYIADANESVRESRLADLIEKTGKTEDELLEVPSEATTETIAIANSIYSVMKENGTTDIADKLSEVTSKYDDLKSYIETDPSLTTSSAIAKFAESKVVDELVSAGKLSNISSSEIGEIKADNGDLSAVTEFTADLLDGKTLYYVYSESDQGSTSYSNGSLSAADGRTGTYEISNGNLEVTLDNIGSATIYFVSSSEDYISVRKEYSSNSFEGRYYLDKTKADAYAATLVSESTNDSSDLSSTNSFTSDWLNGKTFYEVTADETDEDFGEVRTLNFTDSKISGAENIDYSIENGEIVVGDFKISINNTTEYYIETSFGARWYLDQTKASAYAGTLTSSSDNSSTNTSSSIPDVSNYMVISISKNMTDQYKGFSQSADGTAFTQYTTADVSCSDYGFTGEENFAGTSSLDDDSSQNVSYKIWYSSDYMKQCVEADFSSTIYSGSHSLVFASDS